MNVGTVGRSLLAVVVAGVAGFMLAFVLSPDPTGMTPVYGGVVLTVVLAPVLFHGFRRVVTSPQA